MFGVALRPCVKVSQFFTSIIADISIKCYFAPDVFVSLIKLSSIVDICKSVF